MAGGQRIKSTKQRQKRTHNDNTTPTIYPYKSSGVGGFDTAKKAII